MKYSEPTVGAKADKVMLAAYRNTKTIVTVLLPNISTSGVMKMPEMKQNKRMVLIFRLFTIIYKYQHK